jgi:succinoglycan biosynthesis transport protein ExoP
MNASNSISASLKDVLQLLRTNKARWVWPAIAVSLLVTAYALIRPASWEATQALIIRDESGNRSDRQGRFQLTDEMKTTQETVMELSKSRAVAAAALAEVGPANDEAKAGFPSEDDVAALQGAIKLSAPKGTEFGSTEVFYLKVRDTNRQRAAALADAVSSQLQARFQALRDAKAQSMIEELTKTVSMAQADLNDSTARLTKIESDVGSDLAELRMLQDSPSGDSDLRRTAMEIETELRQFRTTQQSNQELLELLISAQKDPGNLLATPNRLLESQPSLRRLKDGLVDAQLRTAQLLGTMSQQHPQVVAAKETEQEISQHLHEELALAVRGVQVDLKLTANRIAALEAQSKDRENRRMKVAGMRAEYGNLSSEAKYRGDILKNAEQALAEARASEARANTANLISKMDSPDSGKIGPSRSQTILLGIAGGLVVGIGLLFVTSPKVLPATNGSAHGTIYQPVVAPVQVGPAYENGHFAGKQVAVDGLSLRQALEKMGRRNGSH